MGALGSVGPNSEGFQILRVLDYGEIQSLEGSRISGRGLGSVKLLPPHSQTHNSSYTMHSLYLTHKVQAARVHTPLIPMWTRVHIHIYPLCSHPRCTHTCTHTQTHTDTHILTPTLTSILTECPSSVFSFTQALQKLGAVGPG